MWLTGSILRRKIETLYLSPVTFLARLFAHSFAACATRV
jgi:hypothetical protein